MVLFDAHNHLQDPRLDEVRADWLRGAPSAGVAGLVVNGTREEDWPRVLEVAGKSPLVIPSLGLHPWYVKEAGPNWREALVFACDSTRCAIGEIGLDRWISNPGLPAQEEAFLFQLRLAAERNLPTTIHCLRHWGRMLELLRSEPRPACGFLLHSYGGPAEMVPAFAALGAYFSISGYFFRPGREAKLESFCLVPPDRLLIETDAPDMSGPPSLQLIPLTPDDKGMERNHPGNLAAVYAHTADFLKIPPADFSRQTGENFLRLFGDLKRT